MVAFYSLGGELVFIKVIFIVPDLSIALINLPGAVPAGRAGRADRADRAGRAGRACKAGRAG